MFNLLATIALSILPMGASVTHTDSGQCAASDRIQSLQVCIYYNADTVVIQHADRYYRGTSPALRQLVANI